VKTILVGYDGSEHSDRALDRAIELLDEGGELVVVAAAEVLTRAGGFAGTRDVDPGDAEEAQGALDQAQAKVQQKGISARTIEAHGDPADMVVQQAAEVGAELIVVGTRGLNAAQRALLGSVSTKVVHHAECDVLVVR
jgi:nucleotide-binding universal stress UspA family protein